MCKVWEESFIIRLFVCVGGGGTLKGGVRFINNPWNRGGGVLC